MKSNTRKRVNFKLKRFCVIYLPQASTDIIDALTQKSLSLTPFVSRDIDGVILNISGTARIHKGDCGLVEKIRGIFRGSPALRSLTFKIGIGSTVGVAWALSRFGGGSVNIDSNQQPVATLAKLPIMALRVSKGVVQQLRDLGIETVADLLPLPADTLDNRFGPELNMRLKQALGEMEEILNIVKIDPTIKIRRGFDPPLYSQEAIVDLLLQLFESLRQDLVKRRQQASNFIFKLEGRAHSGEPYCRVRQFSLYAASSSKSHLFTIITPLVEGVRVPGPVQFITTAALDVESHKETQGNIGGKFEIAGQGSDATKAFNELINIAAVRLGLDRINSIKFHESYIPEHNHRFVPIARISTKSPGLYSNVSIQTERQIYVDRPSHILPKPQAITAICLLPDKAPAWIEWRGKGSKIIRAIGPERISKEWWQDEVESMLDERDYFKVQDEVGKWLWIYRSLMSGHWYLQGVWS